MIPHFAIRLPYSNYRMCQKTVILFHHIDATVRKNWNGFHQTVHIVEKNDSGAVFVQLLNTLSKLAQSYYAKTVILDISIVIISTITCEILRNFSHSFVILITDQKLFADKSI